jgi:hypothetical protein
MPRGRVDRDLVSARIVARVEICPKQLFPVAQELAERYQDAASPLPRSACAAIIAILQGALGGLIFWFLGIRAALLWAVLMAFLSLLSAGADSAPTSSSLSPTSAISGMTRERSSSA